MEFLKNNFGAFINSFVSVDFYRRQLKKPLSASLTFFVFFSLIYAAASTGFIWFRNLKPIQPAISNIPARLAGVYPEELEITLIDGVVSTNVTEPFFIPVSRLEHVLRDIRDDILGSVSTGLDYLLVIDTGAPIEDFYHYQTFALLTGEYLIYHSGDASVSQVRIISLSEVDDLIINRQIVDQLAQQLTPYTRFVTPIILLAVWLYFALLLPLVRLVFVGILSLPVLGIAKLLKTNYSYLQVFQLNLHLFVVVLTLLSFIILVTGGLTVPYAHPMLLLIAATLILAKLSQYRSSNVSKNS
jgi:hypothetical protein